MKRTAILSILLIFSVYTFAQVINYNTTRKFTTGVDVFSDIWLKTPDSIKPAVINPGVHVFGLYQVKLGESNFTFCPGVGISSHNLHHDAILLEDDNGISYFEKLKNKYPGISYDKNKFTVTYLDFPVEFRLRTEKGFRFGLGFKIGVLLQSHSKYRGDDYINGTTEELKVKFHRFDNIETYRFGFLGRVGWKWINVYGFYSVTTLFKPDLGPEMYPVSVGVSILPF